MAAYSQKHDELLVNLFKAYAVVNDEEFREYIRGKRHTYEDGDSAMTENTLMTNAENHYDMRVEAGTWKIVDKKTERIMALEGEIRNIKAGGSTSGNSGGTTDNKWAWKKKEPKAGDPKTKTVNNKKYHWCPNHKMWTVHTPENCEGILPKGTKPANPVATSSSTTSTTPRLQMDPAMETIISSGGSMIE